MRSLRTSACHKTFSFFARGGGGGGFCLEKNHALLYSFISLIYFRKIYSLLPSAEVCACSFDCKRVVFNLAPTLLDVSTVSDVSMR